MIPVICNGLLETVHVNLKFFLSDTNMAVK